MSLKDYKSGDWYVGPDGCDYEDAVSLLHCGLLGFCGCARPQDSLLYIIRGLELIEEWSRREEGDQDTWYRDHEQKCLAHFGSQDGKYFFYYWCDKEGLTEHGGSVPGWLSNEGEELLALLREIKSELEE